MTSDIRVSNFDFSIPSTAIITGRRIELIERNELRVSIGIIPVNVAEWIIDDNPHEYYKNDKIDWLKEGF